MSQNAPIWTRAMEKQHNYHEEILRSNPRWKAIDEKWGYRVFRRSSIFHGLEKFLRDNNVKGSCCFEIGTWNGLTAAVLSQFFDEVVTVDVVHNKAKHEILEFLGIKNVRCIDIRWDQDRQDKLNVASELKFDLSFLDGDHAEDTEFDFDLVKHCGRVLFHEAWYWQSPVWELVNSLPQDQVTRGGMCFALWQKS